jgi:hypothetical protein
MACHQCQSSSVCSNGDEVGILGAMYRMISIVSVLAVDGFNFSGGDGGD